MVSKQDKITYWKEWIGLGSEWLTVAFAEEVITVVGIRYSEEFQSVVVDFARQVFPSFTETLPTDQFTDGRFVRKQK